MYSSSQCINHLLTCLWDLSGVPFTPRTHLCRSGIIQSTRESNRDKAITGIACLIGAVSGGLGVTAGATSESLLSKTPQHYPQHFYRSSTFYSTLLSSALTLHYRQYYLNIIQILSKYYPNIIQTLSSTLYSQHHLLRSNNRRGSWLAGPAHLGLWLLGTLPAGL